MKSRVCVNDLAKGIFEARGGKYDMIRIHKGSLVGCGPGASFFDWLASCLDCDRRQFVFSRERV